VSGFLDKAKEMAESVKDKIEDHIPDSVKEKLHLGNDDADGAAGAVESAEEGDAGLFAAAKGKSTEIEDKVEDIIPGDKDGDGH
jgi:hypothetical protein